MSDFRKALLWTAVPLILLAIVNGFSVSSYTSVSLSLTIILGLLSLVLPVGGAIAALIFSIAGRKQIAAGMSVGVGIGVLALFASCFATPFIAL